MKVSPATAARRVVAVTAADLAALAISTPAHAATSSPGVSRIGGRPPSICAITCWAACLERADSERADPGERRALLTFVVAGGGPGGLEYAGALTELLRLVARRDFPAVRLEDTHVLLVQRAGLGC